jgi:hypothetical protein
LIHGRRGSFDLRRPLSFLTTVLNRRHGMLPKRNAPAAREVQSSRRPFRSKRCIDTASTLCDSSFDAHNFDGIGFAYQKISSAMSAGEPWSPQALSPASGELELTLATLFLGASCTRASSFN